MKIAYLILLHDNPQLLTRTIGTLSADDCGFIVHVDRKSAIREFSLPTRNNVSFCEPRIPVYWSEFSQVEATLLLLRQALACPAKYEYFVFLQGATYPLRSGRYVQQFLQMNCGLEFMCLVKMPAPGYPLSKINLIRYPSDKPARRLAAKAMARVGLAHRDYRRHLGNLDPYSGHACWALSREACQYILEFVRTNPRVTEYFRKVFVPEESFFQTVLGNSPFMPRVRRNFVYADWSKSKGGPHPAALSDEHVDFFEAREKVWTEDEWGPGEMLFARKFSDKRLDLVDRVDRMIIRKERSVHAASPLPAQAL